jgi:hypothetical protein
MKPNVGANISPVATLTGVHAFPHRWAAWTVAPSIFTVKVFFLSGSVGHWRNGGGLAARFHDYQHRQVGWVGHDSQRRQGALYMTAETIRV